jgi:hypothetical protein
LERQQALKIGGTRVFKIVGTTVIRLCSQVCTGEMGVWLPRRRAQNEPPKTTTPAFHWYDREVVRAP